MNRATAQLYFIAVVLKNIAVSKRNYLGLGIALYFFVSVRKVSYPYHGPEVINQSAEGAGGLGITRDNKLGESE